MPDEGEYWINNWVSSLMIKLSENLRYVDDKLDSGDHQNVHSAIRMATQAHKILEEHDNIEALNYWSMNRKELKDWANDILSRARVISGE